MRRTSGWTKSVSAFSFGSCGPVSARLAWILRGKRVGFSLGEIREMIDLYDVGDNRRAQRQATIDRCRGRIALLERQKHDIDAAIAELTEFVTVVEAVHAQDA